MSSITPSQQTAFIKLDRLDKVVQICAIIATVSSIAIIILTGLAVGEYVNPLLPLYIVPIPFCSFFMAKVLESSQKTICKEAKPQLNYEVWNNEKHPLPKEPESKKKHKSK